MNTETGQIVKNLHESNVGGFSWACPGVDGGTKNVTHLAGFAGFDYVLNPNFAHNRAYVLEFANSEQMILESVSAVAKDDARAEQFVRGWKQDYQARPALFKDQIFNLESQSADMTAERSAMCGQKPPGVRSSPSRQTIVRKCLVRSENPCGAMFLSQSAVLLELLAV